MTSTGHDYCCNYVNRGRDGRGCNCTRTGQRRPDKPQEGQYFVRGLDPYKNGTYSAYLYQDGLWYRRDHRNRPWLEHDLHGQGDWYTSEDLIHSPMPTRAKVCPDIPYYWESYCCLGKEHVRNLYIGAYGAVPALPLLTCADCRQTRYQPAETAYPFLPHICPTCQDHRQNPRKKFWRTSSGMGIWY